MEFEFEPTKSELNKQKHGIDFGEATALWGHPDLLVAPARSTDEPRHLAVGMIGGKIWSAIVAFRDGRVRLISVCRAREEESEAI
ncbi:MAG: BrnT family toxin [Caulobacteraceae bacterium]